MELSIFKRNYYCLVAGLPNLMIDGIRLPETSIAFKNELQEQLHPSDYNLVVLLYLDYDNKNILNLILNRESTHFPLAIYPSEYLEEQIKEPSSIEGYLKRFILMFNDESFDKSELNSEQHLLRFYYSYVLQTKNSFLKQWFTFYRDMKNILTAVNCRKFGYDIEKQLIPSGDENEVYEILLKGVPKPETLADEVPFVDRILNIAESEISISEKEKALDNLKWAFLDENTFFHYFTIEKIISFVIKLNMVERWLSLDNETGKALFERLINDIKSNYKFTDEFSVKKENTNKLRI